ncbi:MAG: ATPase, T2SS/T4P/T4SS family, partial [Candidatus Omnitrophica bacterium]|nr:ATPase, T2SS/T4P/T4SS family [Candidatus Omnitrophota bacterium]
MTRIDTLLSNGLIKRGLLSRDALARLAAEAQANAAGLGAYLVKTRAVQEKEILAVLSEELKVPIIDLRVTLVEKAVIEKVPQKIVNYYKFLPLRLSDRTLTIAVSYPLDTKTQDEIRTQLGFDLEVCLVPGQDLAEGMNKYYNVTTQTVEKLASSVPAQEGAGGEQERVEDIEKLAGDASIIKLVNQIILEAYRKRATDIHIEPYRNRVSLRYRVDGILYEEPVPPEIRNFINSIISRIKIMSNLNIVERRLPQDGRAVVKVAEQVLDLRISTIPTPFGESVVIRILPTQMLFDLGKLGLSRQDLDIFERLIAKPHGIVFVTGPTGSGKTTTLYAALSK